MANPTKIQNDYIQKMLIIDSNGNEVVFPSYTDGNQNVNIGSVNGKASGSFFGDNFTTTNRIPIFAAKWSQGLPVHQFDYTASGNAKWTVLRDSINPLLFDGTCCFETGTGAGSKFFLTSKERNRYLPGHLSYFGYTIAFAGIEDANGDFVALSGAIDRDMNNMNAIRNGMLWGIVRESGVLKKVIRFYKNFNLVYENVVDDCEIDCSILNIFEHQIGYYGIHPSILWHFNTHERKHEIASYDLWDSIYTHIQDPNLSWGVYLENTTNTTNIKMYNGSIEFGNYTNRPELIDASARPIIDRISVASLAVDANELDGSGFIAAYHMPLLATMIYEVNATILTDTFHNTISNQLISIQAQATANKPITLLIYMIPRADIVATFTPLAPSKNLLEKAKAFTSISFTNAVLLTQFALGGTVSEMYDVSKYNYLLRPNMVALLMLKSTAATTASDISVLLRTQDLF